MRDRIERLGQSQIQHGPYNDRIYLMKLAVADLPEILARLEEIARERGYSKIFAKVPKRAHAAFRADRYRAEASIPSFYRGQEGVVFCGRYLNDERQQEQRPELVNKVLKAARSKRGSGRRPNLRQTFHYRATIAQDAETMAEVYSQVFATYPFPIQDPEYLKRTMAQDVTYFGIWHGPRLVALSSAEMDRRGGNAEMTDFATLPEYRGHGLATYLLAAMEEYLQSSGITTAYTIARAYSYGMNITFARQGYEYSGTLTNNTNIFGGLESMNVWYKTIDPVAK